VYFKSVDLKERGGKLLMPKTQVNETTIYYQYTGKGTPLFFIPGLGAGINMYEPQQQYFETCISSHYSGIERKWKVSKFKWCFFKSGNGCTMPGRL
jgi:hypothetical protein